MANIDVLRAIVDPVVDSLDARLYDLEFAGGVLRVTLDRPGGVDLETIAEATRQISRQLDLDDPIPGRFTLEVTSPGLERNLRLPEHWATAVGDLVRVKMTSSFDGERRVEGTVTAVDPESSTVTLTVGGRPTLLPLDQVERARTVFVWGPQPKPGGKNAPAAARPAGAAKKSATPSAPADAPSPSAEADAPKESELS